VITQVARRNKATVRAFPSTFFFPKITGNSKVVAFQLMPQQHGLEDDGPSASSFPTHKEKGPVGPFSQS
jgi:hypothetical protein